jgi:hypothetical protein
MPNLPLQTFRTVEPANWGFGASATLCSQPFVLGQFSSTAQLGTGGVPATNQTISFDSLALDANRFRPWLSRNFDAPKTTGAYFPVKVPSAYDRIYIFPMYYAVDSAAAISTFGTLTTYSAPFILPMGLTPQTRGYTSINAGNPLIQRLPEDIPEADGWARRTAGYTTRTNGLWVPLPPYATNALTSNGFMSVSANNDARSFGRAVVGTGSAYKLPNDFSISKATTSALSETANQYAAGTLATGEAPIVGMGLEFQTMGCDEIVCALGSLPAGLTLSWQAGDSQAHRIEMFLMGMFLG